MILIDKKSEDLLLLLGFKKITCGFQYRPYIYLFENKCKIEYNGIGGFDYYEFIEPNLFEITKRGIIVEEMYDFICSKFIFEMRKIKIDKILKEL